MEQVRTILLNKSVLDENEQEADSLRQKLQEKGVCLVNVMSSPGAGKTTTLVSLIRSLPSLRIGVMEADIDSDVDALKVAKETGCRSVQLHTGGMCHLDAGMTAQGLEELDVDGLDLVFLENVGNLVCPAEYDTGAHLNMTILSTPEGHDKPLKYPLIYQSCDLIVVNKIDVGSYFDFDLQECVRNIRYRNESATILPISAKTGEGMEALGAYFIDYVNKIKQK